MRVFTSDPKRRARSAREIFVGEVEMQTLVSAEQSRDLRMSEVHFKSGARNRWHIHTTDQILICTEGEGILATDTEQRDLTPGTVAFIPANTRHMHGAKPDRDMTHWAILGPGETRIVD